MHADTIYETPRDKASEAQTVNSYFGLVKAAQCNVCVCMVVLTQQSCDMYSL